VREPAPRARAGTSAPPRQAPDRGRAPRRPPGRRRRQQAPPPGGRAVLGIAGSRAADSARAAPSPRGRPRSASGDDPGGPAISRCRPAGAAGGAAPPAGDRHRPGQEHHGRAAGRVARRVATALRSRVAASRRRVVMASPGAVPAASWPAGGRWPMPATVRCGPPAARRGPAGRRVAEAAGTRGWLPAALQQAAVGQPDQDRVEGAGRQRGQHVLHIRRRVRRTRTGQGRSTAISRCRVTSVGVDPSPW
jgi:hypothetical protein